MKNKKKIAVILALLALVTLTCGTLAFFTAKDDVKNQFTIGNINISVQEPEWKDTDKWTGEQVDKIANVKNTDTFPTLIRVAVEPRWEDANGNFYGGDISLLKFEYVNVTTDPTQADSWYDGKDGYYYYTSVVNPGESTKNIIESVKFNVPENQKDKYNKETLKAVVRADAVFSKAGTYEQSWSGLSDDVKKMLNNLSN